MGIADPTGFNFLTNLMNTVGGAANKGIAAKSPVGKKTIQQTEGALAGAPPTVLPGGGLLDPGIEKQTAFEEEPSMMLPLYQSQRDYKIGLSGADAGTANLGAGAQNLQTSYQTAMMSTIQNLLKNLGFGASTSTGIGGGGGLLMKLLSAV